jgi:hypothetical protein
LTTNLVTTSKPSQEDLDAQIQITTESLVTLASALPPEYGEKVMTLSTLTRPGIAGMEGRQRVSIPFVQIRQPISNSPQMPEDTKVGELYSTDGRIGDKLVIFPILSHEVRQKWGDENIDCSSLDGVTGSKHGACASCPYGRYVKGVKTECSRGTAIYGVNEDLSALYRINFLKSSAKAGQNLLKLARPPALWARSFTVSTEKQTANNRHYYTFKTQLTGNRADESMMLVCDALHSFFKAVYDRGKISFAKGLERRALEAGGGGVASGGAVTPDADGVIDFSDNV